MRNEDKNLDKSNNEETVISDCCKINSLKLFSDFEIFESGYKYKKVFEYKDSEFINFEIRLINKMFDKKDWVFEYRIKVIDSDNICIFSKANSAVIHSDKNTVVLTDILGKDGEIFFEKDEYRIQLLSEYEILTECNFYIENFGDCDPLPLAFDYARLDEKLFQSGIPSKRYLKTFNRTSQSNICLEVALTTILRDRSWPCEIDIILKNKPGEIKQRFNKLMYIYPNLREININVTFDGEICNSFKTGGYFVEIKFSDKLIAKIPFEIGDENIESTLMDHKLPFREIIMNTRKPVKRSKEYSLNEINELVAMHDIKKRLKKQTDYISYLKLKSHYHSKERKHMSLHSVFLGNPGTGKTTLARMLGKIYKKAGFLSKGHVIETSREHLVAEYIGQTAQKTRKVIDSAKGGILFIDEAYSLARQSGDRLDFGTEVIEVLINEMDTNDDIIIIVAGYTEEMKIFIESNSGLKSRLSNMYEFPDYSPDELWEILGYIAGKRGLIIREDVKDSLYPYLVDAYRNRSDDFGNARFVCELLEKAEMNLAVRSVENEISFATADELVILNADDFRSIIDETKTNSYHIPVNETELENNLKELNSLVGLSNIKKEINDTVNLIKYFKSEQIDRLDSLSFNFIFTGNPGTGKTTAARILAKILKSSGILERGHLIECDRRGLVGMAVGETALKTGHLIKKAEGGILYIDEAYSLASGGNFDFGREAVEVLIKEMEDSRGRFSVICSGYTNNMKEFLESNPGFQSRIDRVFHFSDYSEHEIYEIAISMLRSKKFEVTNTADKYIRELIGRQYIKHAEYGYGNAREIRKLVELIERKHFLNVSRLTKVEERRCRGGVIDIEDFSDIDFDVANNFLVSGG